MGQRAKFELGLLGCSAAHNISVLPMMVGLQALLMLALLNSSPDHIRSCDRSQDS
jgi:hypothetical protein